MPNATVVEIKPLGTSGKLANISYTVDDKPGVAKAWATEKDGSPTWEVGKTYSVSFDQKDNEYQGKVTKETWISKVTQKGGGFKSGGGKADPEKIAVEKERNELQRQRQNDINKYVDKRDVSIVSQVILKQACYLANSEFETLDHITAVDTVRVQAIALDLAETYKLLTMTLNGDSLV